MKNKWFPIVVASLALSVPNLGTARAADEKEQNEQKIAFKEAPSAVRKTLKREAGKQKIKTVDKEKLDGKTVYEADVTIDGHNYEVLVNEEGLLLSKKLDDEESGKSESADAKAHKNAGKTEKDEGADPHPQKSGAGPEKQNDEHEDKAR